jgi:hypothetical protein
MRSKSSFVLVLLTLATRGTAAAQDRAAPDRAPVITVTGCVQRESAVLQPAFLAGRTGLENEFVITFARVNPSDLEPPPPESAEPPDSVGTVYRLTGSKEQDLKQFLAQRIQVTGAFKDPKAVATTRSPLHGRAGRLTPADTPEIVIDTYKLVSEVCSPPVKAK